MQDSIVTDKGHKSQSDNHIVVEFWIQQLSHSATSTPALKINAESHADAADPTDVPGETALDTARRHVSFGGHAIHEYTCDEQQAEDDDSNDDEDLEDANEEDYGSDLAYDPLVADPHRDFTDEEYDSDLAYDPLELDPERDLAEEDEEYDSDVAYDPLELDPTQRLCGRSSS